MRERKNNVEILDKSFTIDGISHLTNLRTEPTKNMQKAIYLRIKLHIPIIRMLSERKTIGRFAATDCCHVLGRYFSINGPWCIDSMDSRAYISQFFNDGSLLVVAFQIWDMRCSTSDSKIAGALSGHIEGITYINNHGDGRYFISNGKDQTAKLWDVRRMSSKPDYWLNFIIDKYGNFKRRGPHWDYRYMAYPSKAKNLRHPRDQSIVNYRGHAVLRTLIRCHFSPILSTGQKYIYTGSNDGCVYIYEVIIGAQVAKLDLHGSTVRDCNLHSLYSIRVVSSWDGIVAKWEFLVTYSNPILSKNMMRRQ